MNILFTICGRAGSQGFKNKNLKIFCGHPLVMYTMASIRLYIDRYKEDDDIDVVLNTDSEQLIDIVSDQSMLTVDVIQREEKLSGGSVAKVSVIRDCLERMQERNKKEYDIVVDLDITSPLRTVDDIRSAINKKKEREDVNVVFSVTEARRNPYFNMVKRGKECIERAIASEITARQDAPEFLDMNASIYAYSSVALQKEEPSTFFNTKCEAILMKDTGILDIDCEEDFELLQVIAMHFYRNYDDYGMIYRYLEQYK